MRISLLLIVGLGCRSLRFAMPVDGSALQGHMLENVSLKMGPDEMRFECRGLCGMESTCVSINIGPSASDGARLCQLSNSDHIRHPDDLIQQIGFLYWATEVRNDNRWYQEFGFDFFLDRFVKE